MSTLAVADVACAQDPPAAGEQEDTTHARLYFLHLPAELRYKVYPHLLPKKKEVETPHGWTICTSDNCSAILYVNKLITREASDVFYRSKTTKVQIYATAVRLGVEGCTCLHLTDPGAFTTTPPLFFGMREVRIDIKIDS